MKFAILLLIGFFPQWLFAQSTSDFYGEWKVMESEKGWTLTRIKSESNADDWGRFFTFHEDGTYREHATAPCGLDDNHYRYFGKWKYDASAKIIELFDIKVSNDRPNIYMNYEVLPTGSMKVIACSKKELKVKVVKEWEKVTKKKDE